jgi:alkylation response protein AidB-like acyl-CoA dehydrogenase
VEAARFGWSLAERGLLERAETIAAAHAPAADRAMSAEELRELFRALRPTGYLGSVLPSEAGGQGLSALQFAALVEGLAPALTLVGNHSVQRYLHAFGDEAQRRRFMPGLLSGDEIAAIAITEDQAGSDLTRLQTVARRQGAGYVLDGTKTWVTHGMVASLFVVLARTGDQLTRFLLPADTPGLRRTPLEPVGLRHLTFARVEFQECEVGSQLRLGAEGEGARGAKAAFPIARMLAALQALRIAHAALALARDYARERVIASNPLADSTLVQHGYAQLWGRCEAVHLLCLRVATGLDRPESVALASAAKGLAGELATQACRWTADLLGSSALHATHPLLRLYGDARMMAVVDGTSVLNQLVVARRELGKAKPGTE